MYFYLILFIINVRSQQITLYGECYSLTSPTQILYNVYSFTSLFIFFCYSYELFRTTMPFLLYHPLPIVLPPGLLPLLLFLLLPFLHLAVPLLPHLQTMELITITLTNPLLHLIMLILLHGYSQQHQKMQRWIIIIIKQTNHI